jgi:hypothetical protein
MARNIILIASCALALATCAPARSQDSQASSPSLGDLARQAQKDKDKEKASKPVAKVLTNDDLPSGSSAGSTALASGLGQLVKPSAGSKAGADPSPTQKLDLLESVLGQIESMDRGTLVRSVLNGKDTDFPGRGKWEERLFAARETYVAQCRDLIQKARQIVAAADGLKGNQDPNDPRVKEMTARLQSLMQEAVRTDAALQAVVIEGRDLAGQPAAR